MTVSTQGIDVNRGSRTWRATVELLSSMRFAISLLTIICIASVIGTVLKQQEPLGNYVNQFGPFWAQVFSLVSLNTVYSAWWFLLILAFLVLSTSLCIARNAPKILADLNQLKENVREQSLQSFGHRAQNDLPESPEVAARRIGQTLVQSGWKVKLQQRGLPGGAGWMVAAKKGSANKLGYIAAHSAIVLVCVGGLLDGDMIVRAQMWLHDKSTYTGGGLIADVPAKHRLSDSNPTFRANLLVAEGSRSSTAILNQPGGVLLQDLPFSIELQKFIVEYYSTGMPKLFASDIIIHDKETGDKIPARVEVNHPASYKGIEIYQSSFDDGGSSVTLKSVPMVAAGKSFEIQGTIGSSSALTNGAEKMTLEYTALRVINVENFGVGAAAGSATDVRKVDLHQAIDSRLGAANKTVTQKVLRNIGPSVSYKLRDSAGQAREFNNYMLPVKLDEAENSPAVYLMGVRETPAQPFQYLRIPVDIEGGMDTFFRVRAALADPVQRESAVKRYASQALGNDRPELVQQLGASASRALALFAGAGPDGSATTDSRKSSGLQAISDFMEANVPEAERNRAGEVLIRILNGVLVEMAQTTRQQAGLPPLPMDEKTQGFLSQMVLSLSDAYHYPAPMAFQLKDFTQVQASVFQVARAPGKTIVYLGCALLILGVFAMLYVRERRVWVWLAPRSGSLPNGDDGDGQAAGMPPSGGISHATMALSTNRKTMDGDKEFEMLKTKLLQVSP